MAGSVRGMFALILYFSHPSFSKHKENDDVVKTFLFSSVLLSCFCYGTRDDIVFPCKLDDSVLRLVSFAYGLEDLAVYVSKINAYSNLRFDLSIC